jgi:hypothetical protein
VFRSKLPVNITTQLTLICSKRPVSERTDTSVKCPSNIGEVFDRNLCWNSVFLVEGFSGVSRVLPDNTLKIQTIMGFYSYNPVFRISNITSLLNTFYVSLYSNLRISKRLTELTNQLHKCVIWEKKCYSLQIYIYIYIGRLVLYFIQ